MRITSQYPRTPFAANFQIMDAMIKSGRNHLESWDDIQYVLAVARSGSYLAASTRLGTNQSTVSRHVQRLEKRLGAKLFDRYSRGMRVTPTGTDLIERARNMEHAANEIERHLAGVDQKMAGSVRMAVPDGISTYWLTPAMIEFHMQHPQLSIELLAGTGEIDLLAREADIAIRLFTPKQDRYVASRVGRIRFSLFADRKYLERLGRPAGLDDLRSHRMVDHMGYAPIPGLRRWHAILEQHPRIAFRPNTAGTLLAAVRAGYGIGLFPNFYTIVAPDLVMLDLDLDAQAPLWLLSHAETNRNARVHAVFNFLLQRFRQDRRAWFS
jgi:DNA-binding transcriptional LysR family regulator